MFSAWCLVSAACLVLGQAEQKQASGERPVLSGIVVDSNSQPVAGATVWIVSGRDNSVAIEERTDDRGRFVFRGNQAEQAISRQPWEPGPTVVARDTGRRIGWSRSRGTILPQFQIRLCDVADYRGRLTGPEAMPIAGARITAWYLNDQPIGKTGSAMPFPRAILREFDTKTDAAGDFTLRGLPQTGSMAVSILTPKFGTIQAEFNLDRSVTIAVDRPGSMLGKVVCPQDPLAAAKVTVHAMMGFDPVEDSAQGYHLLGAQIASTLQSGRYVFDGLPPGKYTVYPAFKPGGKYYSVAAQEVVIEPGAEANVADIELRRATYVHGLVVDQLTQEPIPGATVMMAKVTAVKPTSYTPLATVQTDESGKFGYYLRPGKIYVRVTQTPLTHLPSIIKPEPTTVEATEDVADVEFPKLELERATLLTGVVVDAAGQPVPGAEVWTVNHNHSITPPPARANQDGVFEVLNLNPAYAVAVRARTENATTDGATQVDLQTNGGPIRLVVSGENTCHLRGQVLDPDGRPVEGADVSIIWHIDIPGTGLDRAAPVQALKTSQDGSFHSMSLWPKDRFSVRVNMRGFTLSQSPPVEAEAGKTLEVPAIKLVLPKDGKQ